jgi:hypothetical protein
MVWKCCSLLVLAVFFLSVYSGAETDKGKAAQGKPGKVLRHVVLFKFKEQTAPEKIKELEDAFRALPGKIKAIQSFEWGTNVSVENKSEGFTHCFLVTFRDEAGRNEYLPHPAHKEFGALLGPYLEKVLVLDYWARD